MLKITISHVRETDTGKVSVVVVDEFDAEPAELAARLRAVRHAVAAALEDPAAVEDPWVPLSDPRVAQDEPARPAYTPATDPLYEGLYDPAPIAVDAMPPKEKPRRKVTVNVPTVEEVAAKKAALAPSPVAGVEFAGWTGRRLFDDCKDTPEKLQWYEAFGRDHGFPRLMINWSPTMASQARAARLAPDKPLPTDRRTA